MRLRRSTLGWIARIAAGGAILGLIFTIIPFGEVVAALAGVERGYLLLALLILLAERYGAAIRTKVLTDQNRMPLTGLQLFEINTITAFYSMFLPGDLSAGAIRWYKMSRPSGQRAEAFAAITFERLVDTIALLLLGLVFALLDPARPGGGLIILVFAAGLVISLLLLVFSLSGPALRLCLRLFDHLPQVALTFLVKDKMVKVVHAVEQYSQLNYTAITHLIVLTVIRQLLASLTVHCFVLALGLGVGWITVFWMRPFLNIITMLPLTYLGLGVREGSLILLLGGYGVPEAQAVALGFLMLLARLVLGTAGGLLEMKNVLFQAGATPGSPLARRRSVVAAGGLANRSNKNAVPTGRRFGTDEQERAVAVVVLNYNKKADLLACLRSLQAAGGPHEIIVVDNGSSDGSVEAVAQAFPEVHLLAQSRNLGAPAGRNVGMRYAEQHLDHGYVLFLDDDTVVTPTFIARLRAALTTDRDAGLACGKTYTAFPSRTIMSAGISANLYTGAIGDRGAGRLDCGQFDQPGQVDAAGAFALFVRRDLLHELDGFDERYNPYGWEDVDLCLRARRRGYACRYVPDAIVYHKGTKVGRQPIPGYERTKVRNYIRVLTTHASPLQLLICAVAVPVRALPLVGRFLYQGHYRVVAAQIRGLLDTIGRT